MLKWEPMGGIRALDTRVKIAYVASDMLSFSVSMNPSRKQMAHSL